MSSYESSTTTFTTIRTPTDAELVRTAIEQYLGDHACTWVSSDQLLRLGASTGQSGILGQSGPVGTLGQAGPTGTLGVTGEQRRTLLGDMPMASALVRTAEPGLLARADEEFNRGRRLATSGDTGGGALAADRADALLRQAITGTANRLRTDERTLAASASDRALRTMGFTVKRHEGTRSTGLWATRGDQAVAVVVQDGGAMETDIVGCAGETCTPLMEEYRHRLAEQGAEITVRRQQSHGDDRGGTLIARAARSGSRDEMARGLVTQFEVGASLGRTTETDGGATATVTPLAQQTGEVQ